jgi:hypothetical protein
MTPTLIGRDHPAALLRGEIGRAVDSHGGLMLVTGEAGIGKTALVTWAADEARRRGALVLSGSCWDSQSAPGYWPWVQVIRGLRRSASEQEWTAARSAAGGVLSVLLGERPGDDASDGFQLYDAVTSALVSASQSRPVVVVLDDLHWADPASLRLLEFAAQHTWFERLLLVGTYRDVEVEPTEHPLRPLMLPLVAKATTVTLTGLGPGEVGALMARTAGAEPDPALVAEVHRRTGGNPFFVEQTARLWRSGSPVAAIAPGVRDAVRRRLSLLPSPVARLLSTAAVLGREFHRQVLAAVAAAPVPHVDRLLDQAVTARLVVVQGAGGFAFAHDLVRETLYAAFDDDVGRRHAAVVRAIDRSPTLAGRVIPADLAHHAYLAGDHLDPARAVDLLVAAARDATGRLTTEEAIGHYRRALERARGGEPCRHVVVALDLGQQLHHMGDSDGAWETFGEAVARAREYGDPQLLARVALTLHGTASQDTVERPTVELLELAHGALVRDGAPAEGPMSADRLAQDLTARVSALAHSGDDDDALVFSLWARHDAIWGLGTAAERVALTDEMTAVGRRVGDRELEHFGASLRWVALLEMGDPGYLDRYEAFVALAEREGMPLFAFASHVDQSIICTLTGRFAEAEDFLDLATGAVEEDQYVHFAYKAEHLRWTMWLLQGRYEELDDLHRTIADRGHPHPRLLAGISALEQGDLDHALEHLEAQRRPYPRAYAPLGLRLRAQAAAATRDPRLCEQVRAELAPHRGQWLVSLYGWDISGPVDLWIARIDAARERWDDAVAGFTSARESADRLRARPWSIEAGVGLAGALLARGRAADADAAAALLDDVRREAAEIGMRHIAARVERVERARGAAPPVPVRAGLAGRPAPAGEIRRDGAVWVLGFGGRTVHMPDAKGLHDLRFLLSRPGTDIPAVRLLCPEGGEVVVAARRLGGDPVLDDEAKARYKRRLGELDDEIDRAAARGDARRAAEFEDERKALLDELRAAAGLAGRTRRLGDEAERARKTVTARIRDTLRKLDDSHPELAAHLRTAVTTGATCRYQSAHEVTWVL